MIVETKDDFIKFLSEFKEKSAIIIPVLADNKRHVLNNILCLIFVKILNSPESYILPFDHSEAINLDLNVLKHLKSYPNKKYVLDKKQFLNISEMDNLIDINVLYYLNNNKTTEIAQKYTNAELFILNQNQTEDWINSSVPILKLEERLNDTANQLEKIINENKDLDSDTAFRFLNDATITNLHKIEKNGINVDITALLHFFPDYMMHIDNRTLIYSEYNIYTSTGRPSNRFGNLNFAALHKDDGEREILTSRFNDGGVILYFDYEAYHLNLAADIIGYTFPSDLSIHEFLGRQYFNKAVLTKEDYDQSKVVSFEILYGGIDDSVAKAIPFFAKAKKFIDQLWSQYKKEGYIKTNISGKKIYGENLDSMNAHKLFSYYLQNYETEINILIIEKLNKLLEKYNTKLIMYLYDAFLFDFDKKDGKELIYLIKKTIENDEKYKVKLFIGSNFGKLKKCDIWQKI